MDLLRYICKASFEIKWWSQSGSNRRHLACKASALPAELWPRRNLTDPSLLFDFQDIPIVVGLEGLEPSTSPLSGVRSNHLSYRPNDAFRVNTICKSGQSHLENLLPEFSSIEVSCVVVRTKHLFHNRYSVTVFLLKRR